MENTQVGGRCYTKRSSRNNAGEINSSDAVTRYGDQRRQGITRSNKRDGDKLREEGREEPKGPFTRRQCRDAATKKPSLHRLC